MSVRFQLFLACASCLLCGGLAASAQTNYYNVNGTEYAIIGSLPGDQLFPDAALTTNGGFVVWQDNATDGDGWGISARRLDNTLSGALSTFRVNVQGANDQENPRVALLKNGGAAFVWQGGPPSFQHIYARFLNSSNTFLTTNDILVSVPANKFQIDPAVAVLSNSNVVMVWSSFNQAGSNSMQDVYAKILSPTGAVVKNEFLVNQFTAFNQRAPSLAPLTNGGFVIAWVSEQERNLAPNLGTNSTDYTASPTSYGLGTYVTPSVDIYARIYDRAGTAQGNEFLVNNDFNPCANPEMAVSSSGNFLVTWSERDMSDRTNSWDIYARTFSGSGTGGALAVVNSHSYGDQFNPRISSIGLDFLVTWTSLGQDGSREGVYGQFMHNDGSLVGGEFCVNTTTLGQQMQPVVASDGRGQFLVVWTSFGGYPNNFDLVAQRYVNASAILAPIESLFVYAPFALSNNVYQPQLQVSWPDMLGISISNYEVYVDGATTPMALVTSNQWTMTPAFGVTTNSTHSFQADYVTTDGRRSPLSPSVSGSTWSGLNWYGVPYEWMAQYFGGYSNGKYTTSFWPLPSVKLAVGGPTLADVYLSGGNPLDSTTWLQTSLTRTPQGLFLKWNTQPGFTYQVQKTTDFKTWSNLGEARFAHDTTDAITVEAGSVGYYRVLLLRE